MSVLSAVFSVVSGVVGAIGAMQSASAQAQAAEYNAAVQRRNAVIAEQNRKQDVQTAEIDADEKRRDNRRTLSTMRAAYGSSGLELAGSPLDVLQDSATELELGAQRISYEGRVRSRDSAVQILGLNEQATLDDMNASSARAAGPLNAFGQLASGIGTGLSRLQ